VIGCEIDDDVIVEKQVSQENVISYAVINRQQGQMTGNTFIKFYLEPADDSTFVRDFHNKERVPGGENSRIYFSKEYEVVRFFNSSNGNNKLITYAPKGVLKEAPSKVLISHYEFNVWVSFKEIDSLYREVFEDDFYIHCSNGEKDSVKFKKSKNFQLYFKINNHFIDTDDSFMNYNWSEEEEEELLED
jgi:hypothetical protein